MTIATEPSCRVYAILARDGRSAVVFRRGPSKQVLLLRWWLDDDRIEAGQWFKGRIYERRCDLTADGELLIYFAANWKAPFQSWTAVSRPPYLTALALWPKGDAWGGGGLFTSPKAIGINHMTVDAPLRGAHLRQSVASDDGSEHVAEHTSGWDPLAAAAMPGKREKKTAKQKKAPPKPAVKHIELANGYSLRRWHDEYAGRGEDNPIEDFRLQRDGWRLIAHGDAGPHSSSEYAWKFNAPEIYEKPSPSGALRLRRILKAIYQRDGRWYVEDFEVCTDSGETVRRIEGATWADWQANSDLLFALDGKLYRLPSAHVHERAHEPTEKTRLVADLSPLRFAQVAAPDWARMWP